MEDEQHEDRRGGGHAAAEAGVRAAHGPALAALAAGFVEALELVREIEEEKEVKAEAEEVEEQEPASAA